MTETGLGWAPADSLDTRAAGVVEHRRLRGGRESADRVAIGRDQRRVVGPQLLDREVRPEQAAVGAEQRNRLPHDPRDMAGSFDG